MVLVLSGCGPSAEEQDDAAYDAAYTCVDDFAASYEGVKSDLLFMESAQTAEWARCAESAIAETAPDYSCNADGCWMDGSGWSWDAIAGDQRCNHPEYGDACSLPENQRDPDDPIVLDGW